MFGGLWAATILDRILAAVGSPFGIDTSGMSSLAAAAAVAFAIYSWYSKIKPKPGPTPTPEPQPIPQPMPVPQPIPTPGPQPIDLGDLLQRLAPEIARLVEGLLRKREISQLGPETMVLDDQDEGLEVFGATGPASARKAAQEVRQELSAQLSTVHARINELAAASQVDDKAAMSPAAAVAILNTIVSLYPLLKVVLRLRGVKLPDAPLQQISLASLPVASEGGK